MRSRTIALVAVTGAVVATTAATPGIAAPPSPTAPAAQSAARHFEGTVLSVNRTARTFRLRDSQRGTVTINVTGSTRFQRVGGFAGLRSGMTRIEATVRRSGGVWVASQVERSGGGGSHGGRGRED